MFYVFDNGGETLDRYTVIDENGDMLGLSETGAGFTQFVGNCADKPLDGCKWKPTVIDFLKLARKEKFLGEELSFSQLPKELREHIIERFRND